MARTRREFEDGVGFVLIDLLPAAAQKWDGRMNFPPNFARSSVAVW